MIFGDLFFIVIFSEMMLKFSTKQKKKRIKSKSCTILLFPPLSTIQHVKWKTNRTEGYHKSGKLFRSQESMVVIINWYHWSFRKTVSSFFLNELYEKTCWGGLPFENGKCKENCIHSSENKFFNSKPKFSFIHSYCMSYAQPKIQ